MDFKTFCTSNYVIGNGSLRHIAEVVKGKKVALVVDEGIVKALGLDKTLYEDILAGVEFKVVCNATREPTMEGLEEPIRVVREYKPDYIIAVGGGSVMDSAKVTWIFYEHPEYTWEDALKVYQIAPFPGKAKLICVPTTSGTGSETDCCAMVIDKEGRKNTILSFEIVPDMAILDYDLLKSLPPRNVAFSGADALAHALGAAVSTPASELVQAVALQASVILIKNLAKSAKGDLEARKWVHIGATLAGQAINPSITGLEHTIGGAGEAFHLPHGEVTGVILPYVMRYQAPNPIYAELADQLGIPGTGEEQQYALVDRIWELYDEMGMPRTFQKVGVPEKEYMENLPAFIESVVGQYALQTAPKVPTAEEIETILKQAYYGL